MTPWSGALRKHVVLADAGYGDAREFRDAVRERGLYYLLGVQDAHKVWPPGTNPQKPAEVPGRKGRPWTRYVAEGVEPLAIEQLALQLPKKEWSTVTWR
jgi:SRSO17 transposase